jgi:DNA-binding transcriptional LysR family regulator
MSGYARLKRPPASPPPATVGARSIEDLADFFFFTTIVEHGGIAAASRILNLPKSRLSRRLTALEERYSVQLVHRSSRRFAVTRLGEAFYERCKDMLESSQSARAIIAGAQSEPRGSLRVSACATLANHWLAPLLPKFLRLYPDLQVEVVTGDRFLDLAAERIDIAIRVRPIPLEDSDLIIRHLSQTHNVLVAAPSLLAQHEPVTSPEDLTRLPLLAMPSEQGQSLWPLQHNDGRTYLLTFTPRLATYELALLRQASVAGLGVALLPPHYCKDYLEEGALTTVLPNWLGPIADIHAAYLSRRGLSANARAFVDFLVLELPRSDVG